MREIKFRVWNLTTQDMQELESIDFSNGKVVQVNTDGDRILWPDKECHLMQYTGLKDKNGVEIYKDDVVQYLDGEYSFSAVVEWGDFGWYLRGIEPNDNFSFEDTAPSVLEVIGNIYENPELLENSV